MKQVRIWIEKNVADSHVLITFYVSRFIVCSTPNYNATRNNWWEIGCLLVQLLQSKLIPSVVNIYLLIDIIVIKIFCILRR
jgi:hypothetical protein